jgi:hypothetical protein
MSKNEGLLIFVIKFLPLPPPKGEMRGRQLIKFYLDFKFVRGFRFPPSEGD